MSLEGGKYMANIIFVFGPSCGGKSTLAEALKTRLGDGWTYVERDALVDKEGYEEERVDAELDRRIKQIGCKMVIDADTPWRKKQEGEYYFLVHAPLSILQERVEMRIATIERVRQIAGLARGFVSGTYREFNEMDKSQFDKCFDSSQSSVLEEVSVIESVIKKETELKILKISRILLTHVTIQKISTLIIEYL